MEAVELDLATALHKTASAAQFPMTVARQFIEDVLPYVDTEQRARLLGDIEIVLTIASGREKSMEVRDASGLIIGATAWPTPN